MNKFIYGFGLALSTLFLPIQLSSAQTALWKASVVSVSSEAPMYVSKTDSMDKSSTDPYWPGRPAGHRWVVLTVQLTSPSKNARVPAAKILLTNKDGSYPLAAVGHKVNPKDSIVYLPVLMLTEPHADKGMAQSTGNPKTGGGWSTSYDIVPDPANPKRKLFSPFSVGFFESMDPKKVLFNVILKGESGGRELEVRKSPLNLILLFAVPEAAADLSLKFGDAEPAPVPAGV